MERHTPTGRLPPSGYTVTRKSSCGDRRPKGLVESEYGAGPPASPCRSALDVVASFTTPVEKVSMHNLFLQDVVNGMAYVHVMCVIHT